MDLISQNPYRVLGMFANDSLKVMTANIARIRAYLKVGKQISFISDHVEIFGPLDRSEESIQRAVSQLSYQIETKTWQLFWIHSSKDSNFAIDVQTTSVGAEINRAVLAYNDPQKHDIATKHWISVFERGIEEYSLFEDGSFWMSDFEKMDVARCFLNKLVPTMSSDCLSFEHFTSKGWFWWFSGLSKDNPLKDEIELKYKYFAFSYIKEIIEGRIVVEPSGQKYRKLLWLTKPYLRVLDTFCEAKVPDDIKLVRDGLANRLLDFCQDVHRNTNYWEASQLGDMIDFIERDVRPLSCMWSTSEAIEERLKELRKQIQRLAPEQCVEEATTIRGLIEVPDNSMASESDEFLACGDDYAKLCKFIQEHPGCKLYGRAIAKIHSIEDSAWPSNLTVASLFEYKRKFPNSHNENKILANLGKLLLGANYGSLPEYRTMLQLFPRHPQLSEIQYRIETLIYNQCSNIQDCQEYLDAFPKGRYVQQVKEKAREIKKNQILRIFNECKDIQDYNRFLLQFPTSELCAQANQRIEELRWEEARRTDNEESYLRLYPHGKYSQEAAILIGLKKAKAQEAEDNMRFEACKTTSDFRNYKKDYPNGRYTNFANAVIKRQKHKHRIYIILGITAIVIVLLGIFIHSQDFPKTENAEVYPTLELNENEDLAEDMWGDNSLPTGSRPYAEHYGSPLYGDNEFRFKTSSGRDYVILIKDNSNDKYVDHMYVCGGDQITITVPDGTYDVYFYSGNGWNPNKRVGACTGGFVSNESFQKDSKISMTKSFKHGYYFNQTCEYTLYPVAGGNLHLESSNPLEIFN